MKSSSRLKTRILGPSSTDWPELQMRLSAPVPGRLRFPSRDALEHFCAAVESERGQPAQMRVGVHDNFTAEVTNVEDLFRLTSGKIYLLSITTSDGSLLIDNSRRRTSNTVSASGTDEAAVRAVAGLVSQAKRYIEPVPIWHRWRRTPVVTEVPASEKRDNRWKLTVGLVSSLLGAAAGFVGGLVSSGAVGPQ